MVKEAKKKETEPLRIAISAKLHDYLTLLSRVTALGASENDVAKYLLTQRIEAMIEDRYHEKNRVPSED